MPFTHLQGTQPCSLLHVTSPSLAPTSGLLLRTVVIMLDRLINPGSLPQHEIFNLIVSVRALLQWEVTYSQVLGLECGHSLGWEWGVGQGGHPASHTWSRCSPRDSGVALPVSLTCEPLGDGGEVALTLPAWSSCSTRGGMCLRESPPSPPAHYSPVVLWYQDQAQGLA